MWAAPEGAGAVQVCGGGGDYRAPSVWDLHVHCPCRWPRSPALSRACAAVPGGVGVQGARFRHAILGPSPIHPYAVHPCMHACMHPSIEFYMIFFMDWHMINDVRIAPTVCQQCAKGYDKMRRKAHQS
eukprot:362239-Chlamydomonas_euryale.AAC.1